jgi:hypothetical protein
MIEPEHHQGVGVGENAFIDWQLVAGLIDALEDGDRMSCRFAGDLLEAEGRAVKQLEGFWTLLAGREGRFPPESGSFVRGDVIVKMSELRRKGVPRGDLKIIASDPDLAAITKDVAALNDA